MTLWTHALAALLFGALALGQLRRRDGGLPHGAFVAALGATALWALAVAGIDATDVATRVAEGLRNLAWLGFMLAVARRGQPGPRMRMLAAVHAACALVFVLAIALAIAQALVAAPEAHAAIADARLALRMLGAVTALILIHRLRLATRGGVRMAALALAIMFAFDLAINLSTWLWGRWPDGLVDARGAAMVVLAPMFGLAVQRDGEWTLNVSRSVAFQSISVVLIGGYVVVTGLATGFLAEFGGDHARVVQTAFVFGTTAALLTIVSTPWLRAWTKVVVAKHLFRHRYDYRAEWLRFTETLGTPGDAAAPLAVRVVKAVADVTDSPAGLLLVARDGTLERGAGWHWEGGEPGADAPALHAHLSATHRIVELDAVRAGHADPGDAAATPAWLLDRADAWAIVPLVHFSRLTGAIVLARPALDRALDWEDFDLLGVAGRQVASYLAEDRAHDALADAQRFDEFNRRFAFIMHDLKNLVSQLTLVARNAERHADNPAFRADMVATLKDSADRMNNLLARLSQHHGARGEPARVVALLPLAKALATARRAQHPVTVEGDASILASADPAALETLLGHLVQNAIEASAPDAAVTIAVSREGHRATVAVIDRGCGMSPAFVRDRLFKPFVSGREGGFGLGAFEARQLAEAMGGEVSVESREGAGTVFRIDLPAANAREKAA